MALGENMADTAFEVHIPEPLLRCGYNQDEIQRRIPEWIVLSLFTEGYISSGKAARLLNINRLDFLALLKSRGIAYLNYTPEELEEEFRAVKEMEVVSPK
jgi:predicted HTH domain antitoxin